MIDYVYGGAISFVISLLQLMLMSLFLKVKKSTCTNTIIVIWILTNILLGYLLSFNLGIKLGAVVCAGLIMSMLCFEGRIVKSASFFMLAGTLTFVCDVCVALGASLLVKTLDLKNPSDTGAIAFFGSLSILLYYLIVLIIQRKFDGAIDKKLSSSFFAKTFGFSVVSIFLEVLLIGSYDSELQDRIKYLLLFISIGIAFINVIVFWVLRDIYYNELQSKMNRLGQEKEVNLELLFAAEIEKYKEQKKYEHDIKNHLEIVSEMARKAHNKEIEKYLTGLENDMPENIIDSGNFIIDAIINNKYSIIKKNNIELILNINKIDDEIIRQQDLVSILSNLIDNAIEACLKVNQDRLIKIRIEQNNENTMILISNTYNGVVVKEDDKLVSSKADADKHGIGLLKIQEIVDQYAGIVSVDYDDKIFSVLIAL